MASRMLRKQALNNLSFAVPRNRKPRFEVTFNIIDLTNIPLVIGKVFIKWHLPSSSSADHRGKTDRSSIAEHKATFDFTKNMGVKMTIDKNMNLQPCEIQFEVVQEYDDTGRGARVHLGTVTLNLAEYTNAHELGIDDEPEAENGMITRRYLMQDSKVNATLRVGIAMKQVEGDTNFVAPALKSAMIGGIAGIMNTEAGEADDMPTMANKSRELSEAQDTYRRTLAASWACERGELPPDQLIENLFQGGDGGKLEVPKQFRPFIEGWGRGVLDDSSNSSDNDARREPMSSLTPDMARKGHRRGGSTESTGSAGSGHGSSSRPTTPIAHGVSGRGSIEQQMKHSQHNQSIHHRHGDRQHYHGHNRRRGQREYHEITEFDLRDDLRSWEIQAQ